ncbi:flagellar hook-associated protein 2 [Halalkalibacter alkaliphilus]|uniref:Flagellar hook-associated protein 2 n=1 Tax=Halalkalibacter alkaliphilus TaxID=2917993 RepID=A0A9X2A6U3_9BACI|nr:flagellar hook-associated protein 2 [Halalkalibacter alkaliphilus]MCL7746701.1 flagellar hook-associated protein 2 [Halalkalibacter alkaliphilus]
MRMAGMATGMDINQMITDMMRVERMPLDKLTSRRQTIEWQRDGYREMNRLLKQFDDLIFNGISRQRTFLSKSTTSSDSSKVTATATVNAQNINTQLHVTQTATAKNWSTKDSNSVNKDFRAESDFRLSLNVTDPHVDPANPPAAREVTVEIKAGDKLTDVVRKINSSNLGVTAFIDEASNKFVMTMKETGENANIHVANEGTADFFANQLGFAGVTANSSLDDGADVSVGKNAEFTINGFATKRTSNTFTINDVTYTVNGVTDSPVTIGVTTDTGHVFDSIKEFVDKYNELIETINGKLREERFRDYRPLTEEQKNAMSEREVELWEEKARSGLLRNDRMLSSGLTQMRMDMYSSVSIGENQAFRLLSDIGITTSRNYMDNGKLELDEDKLRLAIEQDPVAIHQLFMADGDSFSEKGIARRLRSTISDTIRNVESRAGNELRQNHQFALGRDIRNIDTQISNFERRLQSIEERYWRQFTAMEKAVQRSNDQAGFLFAHLAGQGF